MTLSFEIKIQHWNWILRTKLRLNEVLHLTLAEAVRVSKTSAAILHLCKLKKLPKVAAWATKLNLFRDPIQIRIGKNKSIVENISGSDNWLLDYDSWFPGWGIALKHMVCFCVLGVMRVRAYVMCTCV